MLAAKPLDSVSQVTNWTQGLYTISDTLSIQTRGHTSTLLLVEDEPVARLQWEYVLRALWNWFHIAWDEVESIDRLKQLVHSSNWIVEVWLDNTFPTKSWDNRWSHAILEYIINNKYQNKVRIVTFWWSREENLGVIRMCIKHWIPVSFDARIKHEKLAAPKPGDLGVVMKTITDLRTAANKETTHLPLAA